MPKLLHKFVESFFFKSKNKGSKERPILAESVVNFIRLQTANDVVNFLQLHSFVFGREKRRNVITMKTELT